MHSFFSKLTSWACVPNKNRSCPMGTNDRGLYFIKLASGAMTDPSWWLSTNETCLSKKY